MMMKIGEVFCLIRNGASIKQSDGASGIPITRIETISNRIVDRNKFGYANISNASEYQDYLLQDGDILMSHINSEKHLGKTALYRKYSGEQIIHGMNLLLLRPNAEILLADYAMYILNSEMFLRQLPRITKKSVNQASFNISALKELDVYVPSINRQKEIVSVLDKVDAMLERYKTQFKRLDDLVKSRFVEMFGEPVNNSKGYPIHQLSDHILFLTSGSRGWAQYYTDKGEWFITIKNVKDCRISVDDVQCINPPKNAEAERTRLREGDLLISITADLGRTGVVTKEIAEHGAYNNQHLTCIRLDRLVLDPLYVAFFMESEAGKRQFEAKNMSAVKAGLNFDSIRSLKLIVPPLALQKEFSAFVAEVDKSKLAVKQSLEQLETLKKSLMQQYFGG